MAIILPRRTENEQLGTAIGGGLSSLLGGLAQGKIQGMQKQQQMSGLRSILPEDRYSNEQIQGLLSLNPKLLESVLSEEMKRPQREAFGGAVSQAIAGGGQPGSQGIDYKGMSPDQALKVAAFQQEKTKNELKIQSNIEKRNAQSNEKSEVNSRISDELIPEIDNALNLLDKTSLVGPLGGALPAFTAEAANIDSAFQNIILKKAALEKIPGMVAGRHFLQLVEKSKPSRNLPVETNRKRLQILKDQALKYQNSEKYRQQIVDANNGLEPARLDNTTKKVSHIAKSLPSPVDQQTGQKIKEGSVIDASGYLFTLKNDEWVYSGRVK